MKDAAILALPKHLAIIAHKVTRENKGGRESRVPGVLFDIGLAVKMGHLAQSSFGRVLDVDERRENDVRNANGLGHVRDIFALVEFGLGVAVFLVARDEEESVRALESTL